jgi:C4-dicarboxylate transporter, DctQ subunit
MPERKQHLISRIAGWLDRALELTQSALLASAVLAMAALNIANVAGRNLFNYSLPFAGELNQLLIVLITFLGVGYAARFRRHIRMSAFSEQLRGRASRIWEIVTLVATGLLLLLLAWYALEYVMRTANVGSVTPSLRLPLYLIYAMAPLGLALGGLQFVLNAIRGRGEIPEAEPVQEI